MKKLFAILLVAVMFTVMMPITAMAYAGPGKVNNYTVGTTFTATNSNTDSEGKVSLIFTVPEDGLYRLVCDKNYVFYGHSDDDVSNKWDTMHWYRTDEVYDPAKHNEYLFLNFSKGSVIHIYTMFSGEEDKFEPPYTVKIECVHTHNFVDGVCSCGVSNTALESASAIKASGATTTRISGDSRYDTSIQTATALLRVYRNLMGSDFKFSSIVVADGTNYADALAGAFLARYNNAPILIVDAKSGSGSSYSKDLVKNFIKNNTTSNPKIYILGGTASVSADFEKDLKKLGDVKRLSGGTRYETNLAIVEEIGWGICNETGGLIVCDASNYADALSASAVYAPILLIDKSTGKLSDAQKKSLSALKNSEVMHVWVAGGKNSVPDSVVKEVATYSKSTPEIKRFAGATRYETSKLMADYFFPTARNITLTYGANFPDGLCGGHLASMLGAPLLLVNTGSTSGYANDSYAKSYVKNNTNVVNSFVLSGSAVVPDSLAQGIKSGKIAAFK